MSFFRPDYSRPGPGVPKNAPQKKGVARYFEILGRDFADLWKANLMTVLCLAPAMFVFLNLWLMRQYLGVLLVGTVLYLVASIPVGPALCALQSIVTRAVRDEPFFFWHEYKKAWKNNWRQGIPLGIFISLLYGAGCLALALYFNREEFSVAVLILFLFSLLVQTGLWMLVTFQMVYMELPALGLIRNSILIFFGRARRTLPAALLVFCVLLVSFIILGPGLFPLALVMGMPVLVLLAADMLLWKPIDELFSLEQRLGQRREERARQARGEAAPPAREAEPAEPAAAPEPAEAAAEPAEPPEEE